MQKKVIILGSTGSVGTQAVQAAENAGCRITALSANSDIITLEKQIRQYHPDVCAVSDEEAARTLKIRIADTDTKIVSGYDGMCRMTEDTEADLVLNSVSGKNGLAPSVCALESGKNLALANKETMVCAGSLVNRIAKEKNVQIIPVDSEHCAIHQCIRAGEKREIEKIILTASGGPFFGCSKEQLQYVTKKDALKHPTWKMGRKITIDSATLANKGLEIIEAAWLFDLPESRIEVLVHRESVIHSMVEYCDHAVLAQLGVPDMRYCASYAFAYPQREASPIVPSPDFVTMGKLTFFAPDTKTFPMLNLAREASRVGGLLPCVYNAANEAAVDLFLKDEIGFYDIFEITAAAVHAFTPGEQMSLESVHETDIKAREFAYKLGKRNLP